MILSEYYNILGLPANSSIEEIKKAYRKKARLYHPDINHQPDAIDKFIRITEAYDFLISNHENRELNDEEYFRIVDSITFNPIHSRLEGKFVTSGRNTIIRDNIRRQYQKYFL